MNRPGDKRIYFPRSMLPAVKALARLMLGQGKWQNVFYEWGFDLYSWEDHGFYIQVYLNDDDNPEDDPPCNAGERYSFIKLSPQGRAVKDAIAAMVAAGRDHATTDSDEERQGTVEGCIP